MAGGLGTRMRSQTPKHLHPLLGRRMVDWVVDAARDADAAPIVAVTSPATKDELTTDGVVVAVQPEARGTGDAAACAKDVLGGFDGDVLVLSGDSPLLTGELLRGLVEAHRGTGAAATVLTFELDAPLPYGRIVRDADGRVAAIALALYTFAFRGARSDALRHVSWIAAASQLLALLVVILAFILSWLAFVLVAVFAIVALYLLFSDRG